MTCRWIARKNLADYCVTCNWGTRFGCIVDEKQITARDYHYLIPAEFPKVPA